MKFLDGTFLPLMKAKFGRGYHNYSLDNSLRDRVAFLIGLATCENCEQHLDYIKEKANAICTLMSDNEINHEMCRGLAYLFCVLADNEKSMKYYQAWIDALLKDHPIEQSIHLQGLIDRGINIAGLEDLRAMDPFEVLSKLAAINENWLEESYV